LKKGNEAERQEALAMISKIFSLPGINSNTSRDDWQRASAKDRETSLSSVQKGEEKAL